MRSLLVVAAVAVVVCPPARAAEPDPSLFAPPQADEAPSAFACTLETLLKNEKCTFESDVRPGADEAAQARENLKTAKGLTKTVCARAAKEAARSKATPDLVALCEKKLAAPLEECVDDGAFVLLDSEGRFSPGAKACYLKMSEAMREVRQLTTLAADCCRCAAAASCPGGMKACLKAAGGAEPAVSPCATAACPTECGALLPQRTAPRSSESPYPAPPAAPGSDVRPEIIVKPQIQLNL